MVRDNLTACYEAIQRVYRNAVVGHLREGMTRQFHEGAVDQIKRPFKKEWETIAAAAAERRDSGEVSARIRDDFDILGVNHFYNLYDAHFPILCPTFSGKSARARSQAKQALLGWMRDIKNWRDTMAHPAESDFDDDEAIHMLYCARKALEFLQLKEAAEAVHSIRKEIDDKRRGADPCPRVNLLKKLFIDGRPIHYLDNGSTAREGTLVFYLHGLGLDCRDFYPVMGGRHRSLAPTMAGFHPGDNRAATLGLAMHSNILNHFVESCIRNCNPVHTIIIVGFSIGADLAFQMLRDATWVEGRNVGFLSLDCNLNEKTCFITNELAEMDISAPTVTVANIAKGAIKPEQTDLRSWLAIHEYLVKVFKKQERNLGPLKHMAIEFKERFAGIEPKTFFENHQVLVERGIILRCILSDNAVHRELLKSLDPLVEIQDGAGHFDLIEEAIQLDEYVKDTLEMVETSKKA